MKKFCVMIMACTILTACGDMSEARMTPEGTDAVRETVSDAVSEAPAAEEKAETQIERTEETRDTAADNEFFENEEARELWLREMDAVDNAISELMQSEGFDDLEISEKVEKMLALINGLAANGTEEYHYPLIKVETVYYDDGDMITFEYAGGGLGGVKLEPFDPMFN